MAKLILMRHGETDWNKDGRWQGQTDIPINKTGLRQAAESAEKLRGLTIDLAFVSKLKRTQQTYQEISQVLNLDCPVIETAALNERNYGVYTGLYDWEIKKKVGPEEFFKIRRSFDISIPGGGEDLHALYDRIVPCYEKEMLPQLKIGKNILVVSSKNPLRALVKYLEKISDQEIINLRYDHTHIYLYEINHEGQVVGKEIKKI